ncbi:MAG: ABC transporter ATP-binding protein [Acidobacteriota bacterium]
MSAPLVVASHLSKTYRIYPNPWQRLWEMVSRTPRHRPIQALDDVSFELKRGESLAVIGENGAGKSTLLAILSGVTVPSAGQLTVGGRVASLLELGMGFHSELTGRQNIRLNAAMMGFSDAEVDAKTPEIIDFSELGDFIDRPVKTYSSGMAMRLGFAIAAQVEPDVLIIDEALSVGDGYFQKKCMDRIRQLLDDGCTFLFCSHAMYYVDNFCDRALWLRQGRAQELGPAAEVIREYEHYLMRKGEASESDRAAEVEQGPARLTEARLIHGDRGYRHLDPMALEVAWETTDPARRFHLGVGLDRADGVQVGAFATHRDDLAPFTGDTSYRVRLEVPKLPMVKGEFDLYCYLLDEEGLHVYDQRLLTQAFRIDGQDYALGLLDIEHSWHQVPAERSPVGVVAAQRFSA